MTFEIQQHGSVEQYLISKSIGTKLSYFIGFFMGLGIILLSTSVFVGNLFIIKVDLATDQFISFPQGLGVFLLAVAILALVFSLLLSRPTKIATLDTNTKNIWSQEGEFSARNAQEVLLSRNLVKQVMTSTTSSAGGGTTTQSSVAYLGDWKIQIRTISGEFTIFKRKTNINYPPADQLAEHLSRVLNVPLIDTTGDTMIKRMPDTTDIPLVQQLKNSKSSSGLSLDGNGKFTITQARSGYEMVMGKQSGLGLIGSILLLILIPFPAVWLYRNTDPFLVFPYLIIGVPAFIFLFLNLGNKVVIHISSRGIHLLT